MITITNNSIFRSDFSIEDYDNYENIETIEDAANVALNTQSIGAKTKFIGITGADSNREIDRQSVV